MYGIAGIASSHSVGLLIKKSLHQQYGLYSIDLKITSDQLFVKKAIYDGSSIFRSDYITGIQNPNGYSGSDLLKFHLEFFYSQMKTEKNKSIQLIIFILRLMKNLKRF